MWNPSRRLNVQTPKGKPIQQLIDNAEFWRGAETKAVGVTSIVVGSVISSQASNTALIPSVIGKAVGGVATLAGLYQAWKIGRSYDKEIDTLKAMQHATNKTGLRLVTGDVDDGEYVSACVADQYNRDTSTGRGVEGENLRVISNPFTQGAIVAPVYNVSGAKQALQITGYYVKESDTQLMCKAHNIGDDTMFYSQEIIEDSPIKHLTTQDIYRMFVDEYGKDKIVKMLGVKHLEQTQDQYVNFQLENFKPSAIISWFQNNETQISNEKARLEAEYLELKRIADDYSSIVQTIKPMVRSEATQSSIDTESQSPIVDDFEIVNPTQQGLEDLTCAGAHQDSEYDNWDFV